MTNNNQAHYAIKKCDYTCVDYIYDFTKAQIEDLTKKSHNYKLLRYFLRFLDNKFVEQKLRDEVLLAWVCVKDKQIIGLLVANINGEMHFVYVPDFENKEIVVNNLFFTMVYFFARKCKLTKIKANIPIAFREFYENLGFKEVNKKAKENFVIMEFPLENYS